MKHEAIRAQGFEGSSKIKNEFRTRPPAPLPARRAYRPEGRAYASEKMSNYEVIFSPFDIYPPSFCGGPFLFWKSLNPRIICLRVSNSPGYDPYFYEYQCKVIGKINAIGDFIGMKNKKSRKNFLFYREAKIADFTYG